MFEYHLPPTWLVVAMFLAVTFFGWCFWELLFFMKAHLHLGWTP